MENPCRRKLQGFFVTACGEVVQREYPHCSTASPQFRPTTSKVWGSKWYFFLRKPFTLSRCRTMAGRTWAKSPVSEREFSVYLFGEFER